MSKSEKDVPETAAPKGDSDSDAKVTVTQEDSPEQAAIDFGPEKGVEVKQGQSVEEAAKAAGMPVVEADAPMQLETPDPTAKGPWIKYNGVGTVRIIEPADWKAAGVVNNSGRAEWNYLNGKRLPVSRFNERELNYLLKVDGRFSLVEN